MYQKQKDPVLSRESDAYWRVDRNDRKSTTGFLSKNGKHSGAISWQVRKQQTVVLSYSEEEYQGLAAAMEEV